MLIVVDEDRIAFLVEVVFREGAPCLDIWDFPKRLTGMLRGWSTARLYTCSHNFVYFSLPSLLLLIILLAHAVRGLAGEALVARHGLGA